MYYSIKSREVLNYMEFPEYCSGFHRRGTVNVSTVVCMWDVLSLELLMRGSAGALIGWSCLNSQSL